MPRQYLKLAAEKTAQRQIKVSAVLTK